MKRVFAGFAVALVILTFIVSVYAYGQNKRFSLEKYIENLSQLHPAFYLGNLMVVWSLDTDTLISGETASSAFTTLILHSEL